MPGVLVTYPALAAVTPNQSDKSSLPIAPGKPALVVTSRREALSAHRLLAEQLAALNLDCDLYAPMKAGLEFFSPRMALGEICFVHDYSNLGWPGVTQAVDEFCRATGEHAVMIPDKCGFGDHPQVTRRQLMKPPPATASVGPRCRRTGPRLALKCRVQWRCLPLMGSKYTGTPRPRTWNRGAASVRKNCPAPRTPLLAALRGGAASNSGIVFRALGSGHRQCCI